MNKFKIGDVVIGNEKANQYNITNKGWTGVVTELGEYHSNGIRVKPLDNPDHEGFEVRSDCFDLKAPKLTKQATLDLLSTQHDCFYSLPQVVEMIKNIEDPKPVVADKISVLEEDFEDILNQIFDDVEVELNSNSRDYVDLDSAQLYLESNNRINVESIDIETDSIAEMVREKVQKVLSKYVTVVEKSDTLEA